MFCITGRVSANGLNGVPVVFSGRHPVMQAMNLWSGIKLQAGGSLFTVNTRIRQANVGITGASQGLKLLKTVIHSCSDGIRLSNGQENNNISVIIESRFVFNERGIVLHGSNPVPYITIENTEIMSNTKSGVTVENWDRILQDLACTTQLNLIGCKLSKNSQHGLETSQTIPGHILVENCSFEQNFQDGLFLYRWYNYGSRMNLTVSSSNFNGNAGRGIYIYQVSVNSFALILSNNNFTGNVYQAVYMYASPAYDEADMIKVIENVFSYTTGQYYTLEFIHTGRMEFQFQNNTCMESHGCLMLKSSIDTEAVIMYNRFKNIYGVSGNVVSIDNAVLNFTYNKVENCSMSTLLEIRNGFDHVIRNNNFSSNSGISCLLKVGAPFEKDKVILAPYNYWGDTDITTIKQKICDFYLNVAVARVKLQFYFADPFMENGTLIDIDNEDQFDDNLQFLNGSYLYGGIITGTLVGEDRANTPILVNRSILIEEAGVLRILGNNVSFTENRGIIVKGHLFVGSNSSMINITTLRSNTTGEAWKGIILHGGQLILTNTNISDVSEAITDNSFTQPGITDKQGFAVYSQNWYNTGNNFSLMNNSFYGYGTALNINGQANELQISHNTFLNNSYVLKLNIRDYRTGFVNISDNRIEHNRAEGIVQIQPSVSDENVRIHVINNSFENNTGSVITVSAPFILLRHNFFANPNANYNLRVIPDTGKSFAGTIINASLTYWGTTDVNVIGKHIYDASYDASLPDVIFRPYLGSMNISNIQDEDSAFKSPTGEIGGMVKEYVTLSIDMSPYLVTSNIEIKEEGTLDLRAGVTLKFKENLGISVFGSLIALGNASHPVQLLSETDDQQWRGLEFKRNRGNVMSTLRSIHVNNTLNGVSINGNFSEISDVVSTFSQEHGFIFTITKDNSSYYEIKVENLIAANNTKSGVLIRSEQVPMNYPRIEIQTCLVQGNTESGFSIEANATVVISKCHILDNHLSGIYINTGGKTHLFSSVLSLNRQYALYAYSPYEVLLESCDVSDHNYGSYTHWGGWQTRHYIEIYFDQSTFLNVTMKNNRLFNNTADGIRLDISYSISSDYFISLEDNTFQNGNRTLLISDYSHWYSNNIGHIMIRNNTFENIIDSLFQLAYFAIYRVSTFGIMNNTFKNSVTANLIFVTGNVDVRYNGNITIYENNFLDNTIISTIVLNTYYETVTISENIFENMGSECEVVAPDFKSTYSIDAKFNFWGELNGESIVEKVCGFEKNMAKSFIYYVPYYIDDSMQQLAHEQDTFNMDGALGGEVTGVVNLLKQMSPYIISRSIMLRNDSKLIIEDGVILQFEKDRGIYALGRLQITKK
ncbi:hypothetical protein ACJMK2_018683 [Sinanodonta woodiana]|uniref:Right handed beta helix domain-containing protein n=1 Tax=Sinanodonta woodiana TaxID=1069815 RepID=A0ABD3UE57_SINWO